MRRRKKFYIIWCVYFVSERSRNEGRKIPKSLSIKCPNVEEIAKVLDELGLKYEVYPDKKYPKTWYLDTCQGYVLVYRTENTPSKSKLLKLIAEKLKELRKMSKVS